MDTYSLLREFADSWMLLAMMLFFLGAIFWALRPGARESHRDAAGIPLRDDCPECGSEACPHCNSGPRFEGAADLRDQETRT